jgi:hypothetical protein
VGLEAGAVWLARLKCHDRLQDVPLAVNVLLMTDNILFIHSKEANFAEE